METTRRNDTLSMFHCDRGLKLTSIDLAIDFRRRQGRGFISHAHADHMAPHELALCTPFTGQLYRRRYGAHRMVRELPFRRALQWDDTTLTTFPAGHMFGSAMLLAERAGDSLLYTGDFKTDPSATAEACDPPRARVLVMESTWGDPRFRLPPRAAVIDQLLTLVDDTFRRGRTPVIHAYVTGKSQEVTRLLTLAGVPVLQHPLIHEVSQLYAAAGCELGEFRRYPGAPLPRHAVLAPPRLQKGYHLPNLGKPVSIAVTGWGVDERMSRRWQCDHVVPLSDHADFDQLLALVEQVDPEEVHCTHGPPSFVEHLLSRGRKAYVLGQPRQLTLF